MSTGSFNAIDLLFYILALVAALFAIGTVYTKHILRSAMYLMVVLSISAGLYLLIGAEFIAGVQVLVYVGGIVVLLVFAVMLTSSGELEEDIPSPRRRMLGLLGASSFFVISAYSLLLSPFAYSGQLGPSDSTSASVAEIGRRFLDTGSQGYIVPFEVISILLLAVLIGGVVIAKKEG